ncbi:MAG: hypothetical protein LBM26_00290 [Methanobrevibacter sp.]|jgi:uncharacterized protein HemX|nr:hypothetical protein [Methanobrevibacter sp.]
MKNSNLIVLVVVVILAIGGIALIYSQNNSSNENKITNESQYKDIVNETNLTNDSEESNVNSQLNTKNKQSNQNSNSFNNVNPKNSRLSREHVLKLANKEIYSDEYVEIVGYEKIDGDYYWAIQIYDKKTKEPTYGYFINDKTGEQAMP